MSDTGRVCDEDANCTDPNFHIHTYTGYIGKSVTITNLGGNTYSLPFRTEPVPAVRYPYRPSDNGGGNINGIPDAELHADEPSHEYTGPITHAVTPADEPYRDPRGCRQCSAAHGAPADAIRLADNDGHSHAYFRNGCAVYNPNNPKAR